MSFQETLRILLLATITSTIGCGRDQAVSSSAMNGTKKNSQEAGIAKIDRVKLAAIEFGAQALRLSIEDFMNQFVVFEEEKGSGVFQYFSRDSEFLKGESLDTFDPSGILVLGGFPVYFMVTIDTESLRVTNCIMSSK